MKTDLYTKIVLTVIAVCLTINVVKELNLVQPANAKTNETKLTAPKSPVVEVKIVDWGGYLSSSFPLPVKVVDK